MSVYRKVLERWFRSKESGRFAQVLPRVSNILMESCGAWILYEYVGHASDSLLISCHRSLHVREGVPEHSLQHLHTGPLSPQASVLARLLTLCLL